MLLNSAGSCNCQRLCWDCCGRRSALRVCRQLRSVLPEHADGIVLVRTKGATVRDGDLVRDLCRVSRLKVSLTWCAHVDGLMCAKSTSIVARLVHLFLSGNQIGSREAKMLADLLQECKALQTLDLNSSNFGAEGSGSLAGVLGEGKALENLVLCNNILGAEGVGRLAGVLGECKALVCLDLRDNDMGAEACGRAGGVSGPGHSRVERQRSW